MLNYALLVVLIVGVWVIQFFTFLGLGLWSLRVFSQAELTLNKSLKLVWIGWAGCVGFLQILHLFAPIQVTAQVFIFVLAVAAFYFCRRELSDLRRDVKKQFSSNFRWLIILPILLVLAILSACADWHYDSGNYHQQSVLWASQSSVVPGLGNLHVRLAFNSSLHLYLALLDVGLLKGNAGHLGNSFLMALALVTVLSKCITKDRETSIVSFTAWLVLPGLVALAHPLNVATLTTDLAVGIVELVTCFLLVELFEQEQAQTSRDKYIALVILAAVGVTIKLSIVLFSASAILVVTILLVRRRPRILNTKAVWSVCGALSLVVVGWVAHGIILSGYPLFPSPLFPMPVEWRVPLKTAVELNGWIRAWPRLVEDNSMARQYQDILSNWDWLKPWFLALARNIWGFKIPVAMLAVGTGFTGWLLLHRKHRAKLKWGMVASFPVIGMNGALLVALFFYLPDIRFAWCLIWFTAALVLATSLAVLDGNKRLFAFRIVAILSLALTAKSLHGSVKWLKAHWNLPESSTAVIEIKTQTGLVLNVPKTGEQCFKAVLPCTPYPSSALSKRENGGFKVEPFSEDSIVGWYTKEMPWELMKSGN